MALKSVNWKKAREHLKSQDAVLASVIERVGIIQPAFRDPSFESLARAIVYQQLHGKAALAIYTRLETAAGGLLTPKSVLELTEEQMRTCGLSRSKLSYIRDLAAKTLSGDVCFDLLPRMTEQEVIDHLTRVKGIGIWSAQMFLMFALRHPNILPLTDYGIRAAIKRAYRKRKIPSAKEMTRIARNWEPYRTLACYYLWRSLDIEV